ncbi:hypothetical protein KJ975_05420 [Myxococcota bacterium]|nr:hypothetical protein [Myxococcota bacterium]
MLIITTTSIPGDYLFQLDVTDAGGVPVCPPSQVSVQVRSSARLVVELVWTTPSDEDETDEFLGAGTDVDLHLIRAGGTWDDTSGGSDCSFRAPHPDWGSPTETDDNPSLDRDDSDGGGPETITVLSPAITFGPGMEYYDSPYQVGVYFFDDWTFGEVYASLRVYLEGDPDPVAVWPSVLDDGGSHPDGRLFREAPAPEQ